MLLGAGFEGWVQRCWQGAYAPVVSASAIEDTSLLAPDSPPEAPVVAPSTAGGASLGGGSWQ